MKILLPLDGSACSERAVEYLIAHVSQLRETPEIHVLHVHPPIPGGRIQTHVGHDSLQRYYREESEACLAEGRRRLDEAGISYTPHIHVGPPAEIVAKLAKDLGCELIVMGSHGHGAVLSLVAGSVATRVLHLSHCPVLLVK